jgi:hypothetical protein
MISRTVKFAAAAALGLLLVGASARAADLEGTYDCTGDNPDGKSYNGTVTIAKDGDTYKITWDIAGSTHVGVAVVENDRLCSSWAVAAKDGKVYMGVVVYKIEKGKLAGRWAMLPGDGKVYKETLTRK